MIITIVGAACAALWVLWSKRHPTILQPEATHTLQPSESAEKVVESPPPAVTVPEQHDGNIPVPPPRVVVVAPVAAPLQSRPAEVSVVPPSPTLEASVAPTTLAGTDKKPDEVTATVWMYAAHSPLRTPEVSDPDSKSNRQILGIMVHKALSQPAAPPPGSPAKL